MRFLVDAQLPPALARFLSSRGHEALHVHDVGLDHAPDRTIWRHAMDHDYVIITKDEDFAAQSPLQHRRPQVIWVRFGNATRKDVIDRFERSLGTLVEALGRGEHLIELV